MSRPARGLHRRGSGGTLERPRGLDRDPSWLSQVRVAVLISGRGTNMLALCPSISGAIRSAPTRSCSSPRTCPKRAGWCSPSGSGIPTWTHSHEGMERAEFDAAARRGAARARRRAGRARRLHAAAVAPASSSKWEGRILNIHPCLLPLHKGLDTHRRALAGRRRICRLLGPSRHRRARRGRCSPRPRSGSCPRDDPESLAARVLEEEHELYPRALEEYLPRCQR